MNSKTSSVSGFDPKKNPLAESVARKLVPETSVNKKYANRPLDYGSAIHSILANTGDEIADSLAQVEVLPELETISQILITSVMSPKDQVTPECNFTSDIDGMPSQTLSKLNDVINGYFKGPYKILDKCPDILNEAWIVKGSHVRIVLPDSAVQGIIDMGTRSMDKSGLESLANIYDKEKRTYKGIGFLGNANRTQTQAGIESIFSDSSVDYESKSTFDDNVHFTDNFMVMGLEHVSTLIREKKKNDIISKFRKGARVAGNEARGLTDEQIEKLYKRNEYTGTLINEVDVPSRFALQDAGVGHPFDKVINPEAVVPIFVPGDPTRRIGALVFLDNGQPISIQAHASAYAQMSTALSQRAFNDSQGNALNTANFDGFGSFGYNRDSKNVTLKEMGNIYWQKLESELKSRLKNGLYKDDVALANAQEIAEIMLVRKYQQMNTQILFIPNDFLTYIAFEYNAYGVGRSLNAKNRIMGAVRANLLFAGLMAELKNAVPHSTLNIELDPLDDAPTETVSFLAMEHMKNTGGMINLQTFNPMRIMQGLNASAISLNVSGNTKYPETKSSVSETTTSRPGFNSTFDDAQRKRWIMGYGVSPEQVDLSYNAEFATSFIAHNLLFAKRVIKIQNSFCQQMGEHVKRYTLNSSILYKELLEVVKSERENIKKLMDETDKQNQDSFDDYIVTTYINGIRMEMPRPDLSSQDAQSQAFEQWEQSIDKVLPYVCSPDIIKTMLPPGSEDNIDLEAFQAAFKARAMRWWMSNNGYMKEVLDLGKLNPEKQREIELAEEHFAYFTTIIDQVKQYETDRLKLVKRGKAPFKKLAEKKAELENDGLDDGSGDLNGDGFDNPAENAGGEGDGLDDFGSGNPDDTNPEKQPEEEVPENDEGTEEEEQPQEEETPEKPEDVNSEDGEEEDDNAVPGE